MEKKDAYKKFLPTTTRVWFANPIIKKLDTVQMLFDFLVKCDYSAANLSGNFVKDNSERLSPHISWLNTIFLNKKNEFKAIYDLKMASHAVLNNAISLFVSDEHVQRDGNKPEDLERQVKDFSYFEQSVGKINDFFQYPSTIILNGSYQKKGLDATDLDFKVRVDKLNFEKYNNGIFYAKRLKLRALQEDKPLVNFMMIPSQYFESFAAADPNNHFEEGLIVNSGYQYKQLPTKLKQGLKVIYAVRKIYELEKRLTNKEPLTKGRLNSKMRDAFYVNEEMKTLFGDKGLIFNKSNIEDLEGMSQKEILTTANKNADIIFDTYKEDLNNYEISYKITP